MEGAAGGVPLNTQGAGWRGLLPEEQHPAPWGCFCCQGADSEGEGQFWCPS